MAYSTSTLAAGCFGKIYREKYNDTWAAIKKVPTHLINWKDLERECQVYNKAVHPNIVKLLGKPTLKDSKWIIPMEFIFGEELETTIFTSSKSKIHLTLPIKATIITGMCEGLLHLHSKDIVHQDLKPDNIMIEHGSYRAVIIDMGLAKFSRNGLSSAMDMGNEAYSPPEVLQRTSQRDQRSDVWAMGKIIAELCARVRLHTPTVCPAKIQETLSHPGQQYCNAVCKMVQSDPRLRATMAEVIPEIRKASDSGGNTRGQQMANIQKPFPHTEVKDKLLHPQAPVQLTRRPEVKTIVRAPVREPSPSRWERAAASPNSEVKITQSPEAPVQRSQSPLGFEHKTPPRPEIKTVVRAPVQAPSQSIWERAVLPKAEVKMTLLPQAPQQQSPSLSRFELAAPPKPEVKKSPTPCPKVQQGKAVVPVMAQRSPAAMKQPLYQEASKGFPCPLPQTGNVRISRYMEMDGEVESWEQKEVETKGGRIVKYEDIKYYNKS